MDEVANPNRRLDFSERLSSGLEGEILPVLREPRPIAAGARVDPDDETIFNESQFGREDRVQVGDTTDSPFNRLCQLDITTADGRPMVGTGWMIAERMVVTAGHCVYRHEEQSWVRSIVVNCGRNGGFALDSIRVSRGARNPFDVPSKFISSDFDSASTAKYDYGSILLPRKVNDGVKLMGYSSNYSDSRLAGAVFNIFGYPTDLGGGTTLWGHASELSGVGGRILEYRIDTFEGQSGAPLIHVIRDAENRLRYIAVGIHNSNTSTNNLAARIESNVFETLQKWRREGSA